MLVEHSPTHQVSLSTVLCSLCTAWFSLCPLPSYSSCTLCPSLVSRSRCAGRHVRGWGHFPLPRGLGTRLLMSISTCFCTCTYAIRAHAVVKTNWILHILWCVEKGILTNENLLFENEPRIQTNCPCGQAVS